MYKPIFFFLLFAPLLVADEPAQDIKKPALASYREPHKVQGEEKQNLPKEITGEYIKLTVSPKTFPDPLLRYRLHILPGEYEPGNSYPLLVEALGRFNEVKKRRWEQMYRSEEYRSLVFNADKDADEENINKLRFKAFPLHPFWSEEQYVPITAEEEASFFADFAGAELFKLLDKASRKRYYDWSDRFEPNGAATLLPNIQEFRNLVRYLQGKADWEIRNGKYEDAVKTIRIGCALSQQLQNSAPTSFLVTLLVGIYGTGMMHGQLQNLQNQPDAPNLYPALTQFYFSQATFLNTLYAEQQWISLNKVYPNVCEKIDEATSEECKAILNDLSAGFVLATDNRFSIQDTQLLVSGVCAAQYPAARQRLVDKGYTEEQIEALSTYQIVVPYVLEVIQRAYDLMYVSASFLPGEVHTAITFDDSRIDDHSEPVKMYLAVLLPATEAAKRAFLRQTQSLDLLKITEALRYYAAVHGGELPASLDDIKEVTVPKTDPVTGEPYIYKRARRNTAVIEYTSGWSGYSRIEVTVK